MILALRIKVIVMSAIDIGTLIIHSSGIHDGRPIVAGTGVTVRRIVIWYKLGATPEEITERIGHISLAQVYAALAYYHANRDAVEADIATEGEAYQRLMHEYYATRHP
jgi:uncharacterized protein (DUF433 family)